MALSADLTRPRPGAGRAIVLLPGAGATRSVFDGLVAALPADVDPIALSLPGRGTSTGPAPPTAVDAAAWVVEVLDDLGVRDPIAAGYSYGGAVALELAFAGRCAALALICTGARLRVRPDILAALHGAAQAGLDFDVIPGLGGGSAATALVDWTAADAFDRMADLGTLDLPALVLGGDRDVLTPPKYAQFLATHLQDSELVIVEGKGHLLPLEAPEIVAGHLATFAERIGASPTLGVDAP